jgi:hypothetical protein
MANEQSRAMVLRDAAGNYYVLPMSVVESARVPKEREAELEAAIGEVTGYASQATVGGGIMQLDGSFLVEEETDAWPVAEQTHGTTGILSAMRMIAGNRF